MALQLSTGLRNKMLDTSSLKTQLDSGFINIYSGTVPATADAPIVGGTLLVTISNNATATGITLAAASVSGTLQKNASETWKGTIAANGTATYYRHVAVGDDGTQSTTQSRIQGAIGTSGTDLNLTSVVLAAAASQTIDFYSITLPTL
jgi:hypothetical protein